MDKIWRQGCAEEITNYKYSDIFKSDKISIDGRYYVLDPDHKAQIMPGDTYLTERDFGIEVFTCKVGDPERRQVGSVELRGGLPVWRYPQECRRVILVITE